MSTLQVGVSADTQRDPACVHYVRDCINSTAQRAIANVSTELLLLDTGRHLFPLSVNHGGEARDNSYVVSPQTGYCAYALHELAQLQQPWLTAPLRALVQLIGRGMAAAQLDRIVHINNWLLSTNLYPADWHGDDIAAITALCRERWPQHAISWRSLNRFSNGALLDALRQHGYLAVPSRQVYLFDGRTGAASAFLRRHNVRLDQALLRQSPYRVRDGATLDDADFDRLQQLYDMLYLDKYSRLNPQYSAHWLRCGQRDGWLQLQVLQNSDGRIDGVLGIFARDGILTAPIVGYDTTLPQQLGLYRLLTRLCLQHAQQRQQVLNFSAGAAHFKRLRGGRPEIEYSMVHIAHLSWPRRLMWRALAAVLQAVAVPLMRLLKR